MAGTDAMKLSTSIALRASVVLFSTSAGIASIPFLVIASCLDSPKAAHARCRITSAFLRERYSQWVFSDGAHGSRLTRHISPVFLGMPAVTVPAGFGPAGLPLGAQLVDAANGGHICSIWRSGSSNGPDGRLRLRPFLRSKRARSEREAAEYARLHATGPCARPSKSSALRRPSSSGQPA